MLVKKSDTKSVISGIATSIAKLQAAATLVIIKKVLNSAPGEPKGVRIENPSVRPRLGFLAAESSENNNITPHPNHPLAAAIVTIELRETRAHVGLSVCTRKMRAGGCSARLLSCAGTWLEHLPA